VNLGSVYPIISGIRIHSYSTSYCLTKVDIYSSADGVNWVLQGGNVLLSTASSYQYIKFYAPISAKYLKMSITGWRSTTYIRIAEFDVYTN